MTGISRAMHHDSFDMSRFSGRHMMARMHGTSRSGRGELANAVSESRRSSSMSESRGSSMRDQMSAMMEKMKSRMMESRAERGGRTEGQAPAQQSDPLAVLMQKIEELEAMVQKMSQILQQFVQDAQGGEQGGGGGLEEVVQQVAEQTGAPPEKIMQVLEAAKQRGVDPEQFIKAYQDAVQQGMEPQEAFMALAQKVLGGGQRGGGESQNELQQRVGRLEQVVGQLSQTLRAALQQGATA